MLWLRNSLSSALTSELSNVSIVQRSFGHRHEFSIRECSEEMRKKERAKYEYDGGWTLPENNENKWRQSSWGWRDRRWVIEGNKANELGVRAGERIEEKSFDRCCEFDFDCSSETNSCVIKKILARWDETYLRAQRGKKAIWNCFSIEFFLCFFCCCSYARTAISP